MMKPRVQTLLLFTTITTMYVAGSPSIGLVALTCLGGALSAGGAGAINHWFDRDLDAVMVRTANRPVPAGGGGGRHPPGLVRPRRGAGPPVPSPPPRPPAGPPWPGGPPGRCLLFFHFVLLRATPTN